MRGSGYHAPMIPWLAPDSLDFPPVRQALGANSEAPGLLAAGGDLSPERLRAAYARGIFPWYGQGQPILWWSPDPRMVLPTAEFRLHRSLRKTHVGRMSDASSDEVTVFRDDTLQAEDKAFFLKVRDVVEAAVSEATFQQIAEKMRRTMGIRLKGDPVRTIEVVGTRYW